jgi:hypothetical protein
MTWFNLLSGGADEAGGDLAVVERDFALPDEKADLPGAGVLYVSYETFVRTELFVRGESWLGVVTGQGAGSRGSQGQRAGCTSGNDRDRGGGTRVLEKHPSTNWFHGLSS